MQARPISGARRAGYVPLPDEATRTVRLEIGSGRQWQEVARTKVIEDGWTAPFVVSNWDATKTVRYRVAHGDAAYFTGTIQRDPVDKDEIVVAAFTGNSISKAHGGDIPRTDIVANIERIDPDLLFFSGDQVYDHFQHLRSWLRFGEDFKEYAEAGPGDFIFVPAHLPHIEGNPYDEPAEAILSRGPDNIVINLGE